MEDSIDKIIEEEVKLAKMRANKELKSIKRKICKKMKSTKAKVDEIYDSAKTRILERVKRVQEDGSSTSSVQRSMTLRFKNIIPQTVLTGEEIKGDDNTDIQLNLVDDSTGEVVVIGPESSANVEIVLLKGELSACESSSNSTVVEEFNADIVRDAQGKTNFLTGNENIKLQKGVAILSNIKLRNLASGFKPPVFALGARVVQKFNGVSISEAKTNSFTVEIYRKKYFKKSEFPSLSDEVYRLKNIWKDGAVCKRLKEESINTVEDFLVRLMIDPQGLQNIMKVPRTKFEATVNNARACQIGQKIFCYTDTEKTTTVVFNVVGTIIGLHYENQYSPADSLSERLKAVAEGLFRSARENWKDMVSFNDDNALHQYFTSLLRPSTSLDSLVEKHPRSIFASHESTIGGSSNTFHSFDSSNYCSIGEADVPELDSFWDDLDLG